MGMGNTVIQCFPDPLETWPLSTYHHSIANIFHSEKAIHLGTAITFSQLRAIHRHYPRGKRIWLTLRGFQSRSYGQRGHLLLNTMTTSSHSLARMFLYKPFAFYHGTPLGMAFLISGLIQHYPRRRGLCRFRYFMSFGRRGSFHRSPTAT